MPKEWGELLSRAGGAIRPNHFTKKSTLRRKTWKVEVGDLKVPPEKKIKTFFVWEAKVKLETGGG